MLSISEGGRPRRVVRGTEVALSLVIRPNLFSQCVRQGNSITESDNFLTHYLVDGPTAARKGHFVGKTIVPKKSLATFRRQLVRLTENDVRGSDRSRQCYLRFSPRTRGVFVRRCGILRRSLSPSKPLDPFQKRISGGARGVTEVTTLFRCFDCNRKGVSTSVVASTIMVDS